MSTGILLLILAASLAVTSFIVYSIIKKKNVIETAKIFWNFVKKNKGAFLKGLLAMFTVIGAVIAGEEIVKKIKKAIKGKVDKPTNFIPSPDNSNAILLETDEGKYEEVVLPENVKIEDIEAVGYTEGEVHVEIKTQELDISPNNDSSTANTNNSAASWLRGQGS